LVPALPGSPLPVFPAQPTASANMRQPQSATGGERWRMGEVSFSKLLKSYARLPGVKKTTTDLVFSAVAARSLYRSKISNLYGFMA
jgi:hypothetical protein